MKLAKVFATVLMIWGISLLTVFILKGWGPVDAVFQYTGGNAVLKAGSFLGAVIVISLVLLYIFGQVAKTIGLNLLSHLTSVQSIFTGKP